MMSSERNLDIGLWQPLTEPEHRALELLWRSIMHGYNKDSHRLHKMDFGFRCKGLKRSKGIDIAVAFAFPGEKLERLLELANQDALHEAVRTFENAGLGKFYATLGQVRHKIKGVLLT